MPFSSPPDPKTYNARVYALVRVIPKGRVTTYGQIARLIPPVEGMSPGDYLRLAPRWVGGAMAACPNDVPWQRVINSQGKISLRPGDAVGKQRRLLEQEAVTFDDHDRVDLKRYSWTPEAAWLRAHGYAVWDEAATKGKAGDEPEQRKLF